MNLYSVLSVVVAISSVPVVSVFGQVDYGYDGYNGPAKWGTLSPANSVCDTGKQQSPVNFASQDVKPNVIPADFALPPLTQFNIKETGHSVQFTPLDDTSGQIRGMTIDGQRYSLKQFHIHTPSEHRVDNLHYDGEIHFVHATDDNKLSVVGIFIQQTSNDNPTWTHVLNNLPKTPGSTVALNAIFDTSDIVQAAKNGAFTYSGSLTTPPCTEGVRWFVTNTPMHMSPAQLQSMSRVIGFSSRPVMSNVNVPSSIKQGETPVPPVSTNSTQCQHLPVKLTLGPLNESSGPHYAPTLTREFVLVMFILVAACELLC